MSSRSRRPWSLVVGLALVAWTGGACSGTPTVNTPYDPVVERYIGTWTAVRMGNTPLPWQSAAARPYTQVSAIRLVVGQFQFNYVETAEQYAAGTGAPTAAGCTTSRRIRATSTTLSGTDVLSASPECPFPALALDFTLAGDSLVTTYRGQRVVLVR